MPRLRAYTKNARTAQVVKDLVKHGMSQASMARAKGITQQAVSNAVRRPEVQIALAKLNEKALAKAGASLTKVYKRINEALNAKVVSNTKAGAYLTDIADADLRLKAAIECLELTGRKRTTANSDDITKPTEIHIHYGHRRPDISAVRQES